MLLLSSFVFAAQFENRNKTIALPFDHFCDFLMRFSSFQIQIDARGANFASDCKFNRINPIFREIFFQEHKLLSSPCRLESRIDLPINVNAGSGA